MVYFIWFWGNFYWWFDDVEESMRDKGFEGGDGGKDVEEGVKGKV